MKTICRESVWLAIVFAVLLAFLPVGPATSALAQTWSVAPIPASGDFGWHVEVEVDSTGLIHGASYLSGGDLWYGQYEDSSWSSEYPDLGSTFSLSLDSSGRPHVAFSYYESGQHHLALSRRTDAGIWETSSIPTGPTESPQLMALDFDSQDRAHVAYKDTAGPALRHAYQSGTGWNNELILYHSEFGFANQSVNMAMDHSDAPHFVWSDFAASSV